MNTETYVIMVNKKHNSDTIEFFLDAVGGTSINWHGDRDENEIADAVRKHAFGLISCIGIDDEKGDDDFPPHGAFDFFTFSMHSYMAQINGEDIDADDYFITFVKVNQVQVTTSEFIEEITVKTDSPIGELDVELSLFKSEGGGLFGVESSYIDNVLEGNCIQSPIDPGLTRLNGID